MDIELILYIIFIAIAIIARVLKSNKPTAQPPTADYNTIDEEEEYRPQSNNPTFEDLLREFTQQKNAPSPEQPVREHKKRSVAPSTYEYEETVPSYQDQQARASKLKTLDEQVDLDRPLDRMSHFKAYDKEEESSEAANIYDMLRDSDSARRAIIISEIINKKYQ